MTRSRRTAKTSKAAAAPPRFAQVVCSADGCDFSTRVPVPDQADDAAIAQLVGEQAGPSCRVCGASWRTINVIEPR